MTQYCTREKLARQLHESFEKWRKCVVKKSVQNRGFFPMYSFTCHCCNTEWRLFKLMRTKERHWVSRMARVPPARQGYLKHVR